MRVPTLRRFVGRLAEQHAAPIADDVLDDRAGTRSSVRDRLPLGPASLALRAMALDLDAQLAGRSSSTSTPTSSACGKQLEQRVDDLVEQRLLGCRRASRGGSA
jgi:hypothetical protein